MILVIVKFINLCYHFLNRHVKRFFRMYRSPNFVHLPVTIFKNILFKERGFFG